MSTGDRRSGAVEALLLGVGVAAAALYATPLGWPPGPDASAPPPVGASLLERLFPGVPGAWVAVRLLALGLATTLASVGFELPAPNDGEGPGAPPSPRRIRLALGLAAAGLASAFATPRLSQGQQMLWIACLALPALVLARPARPRLDASGLAVLGVVAVWVAVRGPASWRAVRTAELVDTWVGHEVFVRAAVERVNTLIEGFLPGHTAVNLLFQGVAFWTPGSPASAHALLQATTLGWLAVTGAGIGLVARVWVSPAAGPVAAAAFLFAPFTASLALSPTPFFVGPLLGTASVALWVHARRSGSVSALAAQGALAGLAVRNLGVLPLTGLALVGTAWAVWQRGSRAPAPFAIALLAAVTAALPGLPSTETLRLMAEDFAGVRGQWVGLESVLFGQLSPFRVPELWNAGRPGPLDVPLGALLAPFAVPRTPMRLWGDAWLDPVGAVLTAVGIGLSLRAMRHRAAARWWLALLLAAILPAFTSSYDRASLTRMFAAPVLTALLAGVGFAGLARGLAPDRRAAVSAVAVAAIALGGTTLFDVVNPRILRGAWISSAIESLAPADRERAALLVYGGPFELGWLHDARIASVLAWPWLETRAVADAGSLAAKSWPDAAPILLWSPALEQDRGIEAAVCARWPAAVLFTLWDRPRRSRTLAASTGAERWEPSVARERVDERRCGARPPGAR